MKRNTGIILLLISIVITAIGSVFKIMNQFNLSEAFLWIGMVMFVIAIGMIIYRLIKPIHTNRKSV